MDISLQKYKKDALLIAGILFIAVLLYMGIRLFSKTGQNVTVQCDDKVIATYSLNNTVTKTITTPYGNNVLTIADGKVSVTSADCPDNYCVNQGDIANNGESIICLPHKLIISINDD